VSFLAARVVELLHGCTLTEDEARTMKRAIDGRTVRVGQHQRNEKIHGARRMLAQRVIEDQLRRDFWRIRGGACKDGEHGYRDPDQASAAIENVALDMVKRLTAEGVIT